MAEHVAVMEKKACRRMLAWTRLVNQPFERLKRRPGGGVILRWILGRYITRMGSVLNFGIVSIKPSYIAVIGQFAYKVHYF